MCEEVNNSRLKMEPQRGSASVFRSLQTLLCSVHPHCCQSPSQSWLCSPFPSTGCLRGHILHAPVTLPLSQEDQAGPFSQHCHHWPHWQPNSEMSLGSSISTCTLEMQANESSLTSGAWRDQRQGTSLGRCKIPSLLVILWKISLK